jgi:hypothetical protein
MTPTAKMTPTVTLTPTVTPTTTVVVTGCTGADPHPHASTLAVQFRVPYDEIMGWKCSGFGFGEIKHAYTLSQTGFTAADIFEMRRSGLGWGQIKKLLLDGDPEEDGRPGGNPNKNSQDNPHGKKDKGHKDKGDGQNADLGNGNNGKGRSGQAILGHGNSGQGGKDKGNRGQSIKGGGKKDK